MIFAFLYCMLTYSNSDEYNKDNMRNNNDNNPC
jgi:hypothetical protein